MHMLEGVNVNITEAAGERHGPRDALLTVIPDDCERVYCQRIIITKCADHLVQLELSRRLEVCRLSPVPPPSPLIFIFSPLDLFQRGAATKHPRNQVGFFSGDTPLKNH